MNSGTPVAIGLALAFGLLATACAKKGQALFGALHASDFGLEIHFDQTPAQVKAVLGPPSAEFETQGGLSLTYYYLPEDITDTGADSPQLALTFLRDKLARLYNRYVPDDPELPPAPLTIEPLAGIELGNRKSDFVTALGPPTDPVAGNEWEFKAKDGRTIMLTTAFASPPGSNDQLCSALQIVLAPSIAEARGEELEKGDWRKKVGLD